MNTLRPRRSTTQRGGDGIVFVFVKFVVTVFESFYQAFFGWWLDPLSARMTDRAFAKTIYRETIVFLEDHNMQRMPNDVEDYRVRRAFNLAFAVFGCAELQLRFQRFQNELSVFVRPASGLRRWEKVEGYLETDNAYSISCFLNKNWESLVKSVRE